VTIAPSLDLGTQLVGFLPALNVILVFIAIAIIFTLFPPLIGRHLRRKRNLQWLDRVKSLQEIQKLKPVQFEQLVAGLFQSSGYKTTTTKGSYDGGVDVIAVKDPEGLCWNAPRVLWCLGRQVEPCKGLFHYHGHLHFGG
jgi:hypothetical protein